MKRQSKLVNHLYEDHFSTLSLFELINCLLKISKEKNSLDKALALSKKYPSITTLLNVDLETLNMRYKLNDNSILLFRSIKEMVLRRKKEEIYHASIPSNYDAFIEYCKIVLGENSKEIVGIFYLDGEWRIIEEEFLSQGDAKLVHCNTIDITRKALSYRARGVVIAHNHPSGALIASPDDLRLTQDLKIKLHTFQIVLLDSLIFTHDKYISILKEEPLFNNIESRNLGFTLSSEQKETYFYTIKAISRLMARNLKKDESINTEQIEDIVNTYKKSGLIVSNNLILEFLNEDEIPKIRSNNPKYLGKRYMQILNTRSPTYFSYLDIQERFQIVSTRYSLIFEKLPFSIIGKSLREMIGEEGYEICKPFLKKAFKGNRCSFRYPWNNSKGILKYIKLHYIPHVTAKKEVKGIAVFLESVSSSEILQNMGDSSSISSILPKHLGHDILEVDDVFFAKVMSTVKDAFRQCDVVLNASVLIDTTNNVYHQFYDSKKIELGYIKAIITNGLKTGKLTKNL